jgi:hypothetical protein
VILSIIRICRLPGLKVIKCTGALDLDPIKLNRIKV